MQTVNGKIFTKTTISEKSEKSIFKEEADCTLTIADNGEYTVKYIYDNAENVIRLLGKNVKALLFGDYNRSIDIIPGEMSLCNITIKGESMSYPVKGVDVKYNLDENGGNIRLRYIILGTVTVEMRIVANK